VVSSAAGPAVPLRTTSSTEALAAASSPVASSPIQSSPMPTAVENPWTLLAADAPEDESDENQEFMSYVLTCFYVFPGSR